MNQSFYKVFSGFDFIRTSDQKVELFHSVACLHCYTAGALSEITILEPSDEVLLEAGLRRYEGVTKPPSVFLTHAGGPALCKDCLARWRRAAMPSSECRAIVLGDKRGKTVYYDLETKS